MRRGWMAEPITPDVSPSGHAVLSICAPAAEGGVSLIAALHGRWYLCDLESRDSLAGSSAVKS